MRALKQGKTFIFQQFRARHKEKYSNNKETSDFHGPVSFDPVKMLQQK